MKKLKAIVVGCGNRGLLAYSVAMESLKDKYEIVAAAEPVEARLNDIKERFNIKDELCFNDWKELAKLDKIADIAVIATQDNMHYEPALAFIDKKYDLLLEKPIAPTPKECMDIVLAAEKNNVNIVVCHVLRYTPFYSTLKKILMDGVIGKVLTINHAENVGNAHYSHSYVRGNWRNTKESTPMILAKSCHDTDLISWLLDDKCTKIQSFGSLDYFRAENAPEGAPMRCTDGCKYADSCFYYAPKLYCGGIKNHDWFRPVVANKPNPADEEVFEAVKTGPYGRCVFHCDNDVVDHQTLNMEFESGATVVFTMNAFNEGGRFTKIMGTKGEIIANMEDENIDVYTFSDREHHSYKVNDFVADSSIASGHGGGDLGIVEAMYSLLTGTYNGFTLCDIRTSAVSHLMCFAAEESRLSGGKTIDMEEYTKKFVK